MILHFQIMLSARMQRDALHQHNTALPHVVLASTAMLSNLGGDLGILLRRHSSTESVCVAALAYSNVSAAHAFHAG